MIRCSECNKVFHSLGFARHRRAHIQKREDQNLILTKKNLHKWKDALDRESKRQKLPYKLSETKPDNDWLKENIGDDVYEIVSSEVFYARQDS